jgi:SNF2 family DNA or RNA helicase
VEAFNSSDQAQVFLLSLRAAGTGLTLTRADYVFIFDPWWNPAVERQAIDRTHRIGQDKPVFAYRLVAQGTVEERVLALQAEKARLSAEVLADTDSGGGFAQRLTREDLERLLE